MEANALKGQLGRLAVGGKRASGRSEATLITLAARGNPAAAEELVRRHWLTAYRAGYLIGADLHLAEEVAQETMIRALEALSDFDRDRALGPWIYRIAVNLSIDRLRSGEREFPSDQSEAFGHQGHFDAGDSSLDPKLAGALELLSGEDRAAVVMRYVLGFKASEIGEVLGLSEPGARTRLHRAMKRLRAEMEDK